MWIVILAFIIGVLLGQRQIQSRNQEEYIVRLLRQTGRWAIAAQQDENPYIANLHATYAMGYLMALRELYTDETIRNMTGVDVRHLSDQISYTMDRAIQQLVTICPEGAPKNELLAALARGEIFK
jgi:hypothetical protein